VPQASPRSGRNMISHALQRVEEVRQGYESRSDDSIAASEFNAGIMPVKL